MVLDQATNFARGETTSSIASTDSTIDVANASTFADPATGEYNLVLWDQTQYARPTASGASPEIVRVTGRDTTNDSLTVSRGQEGTAAGSFPSGAALIHTQTAKTFGDIDSTFASFWDEQNQELTADINATNGDIDSLSTDEVNTTYHITEAEANNGIFTAVSDILQNTDKGVKIELPTGEYPAGQRLNVRSGASTSLQRAERAVVIEGSGMINDITNTSADAGTIVDASGLSGSALYTNGDKNNLHLRNFSIDSPTVGIDLSNGRSNGGGIRNVSVNNASSWGFDIQSVFGFYLTNLDSRYNDRSYRFVDCQADSFRNIISRLQTGTAPDIQLTEMGGTEITNLYTEQCAGTMLQIGGDAADGGLTINNMWLENANQSNQNVPAVLVGDSGLNSNLVNSLTITGGNFASQANAYDEWFLLDNAGKVELNGFYTDNPSASVSVRDTSNADGPLTVINSRLEPVAADITNIDYTAINSFFDAAERNMFSTAPARFDEVTAANVGTIAEPSSNQTINSGSLTTVNLDTTQREDDPIATFDATANRINVQTGGLFLIVGAVATTTNMSAGDQLDVRLNESGTIVTRDRQAVGGTINEYRTVTAFDTGGSYDLSVFQDSGSGVDLRSADTFLGVVKLG